eukprot:1160353-Pelagomonas_calceolata.AAC.14
MEEQRLPLLHPMPCMVVRAEGTEGHKHDRQAKKAPAPPSCGPPYSQPSRRSEPLFLCHAFRSVPVAQSEAPAPPPAGSLMLEAHS